jgi:lipopolysaccharide biosynthesis glycosyltransferase
MISPKSTLVVTLCIGKLYEEISLVTHPFMRSYAEKIGADFQVITIAETKTDIEYYEKFQLYSYLERYERVIFLDTDLLVSPQCPDLFSVVPETHFGAFLVSQYSNFHDSAIRISQEILGNIDWNAKYFNSGVMVFSKAHREVFSYQDSEFKTWSSHSRSHDGTFLDQTLLNYRVFKAEIPFFDIGYFYNHTTAPRNSSLRFRSHIIHYPGKGHRKGGKLEQIRKDAYVLKHPFICHLFSLYPTFTSLIDAWM